MHTGEIIETSSAQLSMPNGDISSLPMKISQQVNEIKKLDDKVKYSLAAAEEAKSKAAKAAYASTGWGHKKAAIEQLQDAVSAVSEGLVSNAEASTLILDYQKQLSEITQGLFALGVSSIAANRSVVQELELKLKGASEEELSDLARKEIGNVIEQLNQQRDMFGILNAQNQRVGENSKQIEDHTVKLAMAQKQREELTAQMAQGQSHDRKQDAQLSAMALRGQEHDRLIAEGRLHDEAQDRKLQEQIQKDQEHDKLIAEGQSHDVVQDAQLAEQVQKDREHDAYLNKLQIHCKNLDMQFIEQQQKNDYYEKRLSAQEGYSEIHRERLSLLECQSNEHSRDIAVLVQHIDKNEASLKNTEAVGIQQLNLIKALEVRCEVLETQLASNESKLLSLQSTIDSLASSNAEKATKIQSWISLSIGIISLIIAGVHFFL